MQPGFPEIRNEVTENPYKYRKVGSLRIKTHNDVFFVT